MFDLITGTKERPLRQKMLGPKVLSIAAHVVVVTLLIVIPLLRVTNTMPAIPTMMAFVASVPPPPPPPPPPPAPAARPVEAKAAVHTATAPQNPLLRLIASRPRAWKAVSRAVSKAASREALSAAFRAESFRHRPLPRRLRRSHARRCASVARSRRPRSSSEWSRPIQRSRPPRN
jgi:hypothetical protein